MVKFDLKKIKYFRKNNNARKRRVVLAMFFGLALMLFGAGYIGAKNGWFGGGAVVPEDTFSRGLVGYWSFDEGKGNVAYDASGNGNTGTLTNGPKWTSDKNGNLLQFDGKDDYVDCGNGQTLAQPNITVEAWIKISSLPTDTNVGAVIAQQYSSYKGFFLSVKNNGKVHFRPHNGTGAHSFDSNYSLSVNKWYHVVGIIDGTNGYIYINGQRDGSRADLNYVVPTGINFSIGRWSAAGIFPFDGKIDEVKIYNRALNEVEIKYHYNHGGPVGYWNFDEGNEASAKDISGNNNDGTVSGATWVDGRFGSALSFDGINDYVDCGNKTSLDIINDITVSAWIFPNELGFINAIAAKGTDGTDYSFYLGTGSYYGNTLSFQLRTIGGITTGSIPIEAGKWNYVVGVRNGTTMSTFVNGKLANRTTGVSSSSIPTNFVNVLIGKYAGGNIFNGVIDDLRVYAYARTADEIRLDYQAGMAALLGTSGKTCSEDPASCMDKGLAGYWDMDEGRGLFLNDKSGNGNNGILANGPKWVDGKKGDALQFDGRDDYGDVVAGSSLTTSSVISIETWIKTDNPSQMFAGIVGKVTSNVSGWIITLYNGNIDFWTKGAPNQDLFASSVITGGGWYHIVCVHDGTRGYIYINGELKARGDKAPLINSAANLIFGYSPGWNYRFKGSIDNTKVYDRVLLAEEVRYHYNQGRPVGYWNFDEGSGVKAVDSSGNNNDGTLANAPAWAEGKYGTALNFDGTDDYISFAANPNTNPQQHGWTATVWVKSNQKSGGNGGYIRFMGRYEPGDYWLLRTHTLNGDFPVFQITDGTNSVGVVGKTTVTDGEWHHLAFVYDYNNSKTYIYRDGAVDGFMDWTGTNMGSINPGATLEIGRAQSGIESYQGLLDDIKIYDYARSADQIKQDFQAGAAVYFGPSGKTCSEDPASCMDKGLVGYWDMNEGRGAVLKDKSGNGNNGAVINGPKWTMGKNRTSLQFDGKDDYVNVGNGSSLNPTQSITIEGWFRFYDYIYRYLVSKREGYSLGKHSVGRLVFLDKDTNIYYSNSNAYLLNKWQHVVVTAQGTELNFYVDGVNVGHQTMSSTIGASAYNTLLANWWGGGVLRSDINGLRIYNRALSVEEVRYHYNEGAPAAYWDLDEGQGLIVNDRSGNHNKGAISGATWMQGKFGSALSFDGVDDYIQVPDSFASQLNSNDFTMSAWLRSSYTLTNKVAIGKYGGSGNDYWLGLATGRAVVAFNGLNNAIDPDLTASDGNWHHVTGVRSGNALLIYVDGILKKTAACSGVTAPTNYLGIGKFGSGGGYYWEGQIDEVRIYKYARTAEQIKMDYQQGVATHLE